jgi:hypothetical protein
MRKVLMIASHVPAARPIGLSQVQAALASRLRGESNGVARSEGMPIGIRGSAPVGSRSNDSEMKIGA